MFTFIIGLVIGFVVRPFVQDEVASIIVKIKAKIK